jgi:undecaprenyl-phosphate 4-deoxy-4-formamido-L-arabinose transferase
LKYKGPYPYLTGLVLRITGNIGTVNTRHEARQYGKSNYGFIKLLRLWFNGFTSFSVKPLRISFFTGLVLAMAGFVSAIVILIKKFIDTDIIIGWTSIIVVILIFAGIQLISLGIIGEYIGRIFMSQNSQPQYIIKDKFNIK